MSCRHPCARLLTALGASAALACGVSRQSATRGSGGIASAAAGSGALESGGGASTNGGAASTGSAAPDARAEQAPCTPLQNSSTSPEGSWPNSPTPPGGPCGPGEPTNGEDG